MGLLGALGAIIGTGEALVGYNQARQKEKGQKGAIARAYQMATMQQGVDQANTRQDTIESLNARGVLAAGAPQSGAPLSPIGRSVAQSGAYRNIYNTAQAGSVGASNTLGGQVNANLGDQFYREGKDLYDNKEQALNQVKADAQNAMIGSVVGGVQTAFNIGGAPGMGSTIGGVIQGAYGMPANLQPSSASASMGVPSTGATGGLPKSSGTLSGDSSTANYNFNVG